MIEVHSQDFKKPFKAILLLRIKGRRITLKLCNQFHISGDVKETYPTDCRKIALIPIITIGTKVENNEKKIEFVQKHF